MNQAKIRLYFYTSRHTAQDISSSLVLHAGPWMFIPLSPDQWQDGAAAAAHLALCQEPIEFRCEVEIEQENLRGPFYAEQIYGPDGVILRPGGGMEYHYHNQTLVFGDPPQWMGLDPP